MPEIRRGDASSPSSPLAPIQAASDVARYQNNDEQTPRATDDNDNEKNNHPVEAATKPKRRSITLNIVRSPRHSTGPNFAETAASPTVNASSSPPPAAANTTPATGIFRSPSSSSAVGDHSRRSVSYAHRESASAYYDSRAATRAEWRRRARTLEEYYDDNPSLLPQLPFTWHHGWRRWRLFLFAFLVFVDACAVPIALYYGMFYAGDVEGWIIFAVVTTIWGGPTYLEFAVRTLRLIKKERFYRPLGTNSRWCFDLTTYASVIVITAVTALFIIGSVPHIVWLRVLSMPAPAILYSIGGVMCLIQLYHTMGWKAPFRLSSTPKGGEVLPPVYYFIEDIVAVNAGAGRPFREALAARYKASPRFRQMLNIQSLFWEIPAVVIAIPLTVIAVIHSVPATGAYGICWAVPFLWMVLWGTITIFWCKRDMVRERLEWQAGKVGEEAMPLPSRQSLSETTATPPDKSQHTTTPPDS